MSATPLDLLCVGYLADAQVLRVDRYPAANRGAPVIDLCTSLAGDAPIAALLAVQHGLTSGLVANPVGDDIAGRRLLAWLQAEGVRTSVCAQDGSRTPHLTVISDSAGTRTWFAWLEHAYTGLDDLDLRPAVDARLVYIDCYEVIDNAAATAAAAVAALGIPMLLNLGGDPLSQAVADAVAGARIAAVQTTVGEDDIDHAEQVAATLFAQLEPQAAIVTVGRHGALAHTASGLHHAPAGDHPVLHTHGAGAAFSAGYAAALLEGADIPAALRSGCLAGTAHCARWPHPTVPRRSTPITSAAERTPDERAACQGQRPARPLRDLSTEGLFAHTEPGDRHEPISWRDRV